MAALIGLVLLSCTRIDLTYRNLDRLIPWSLSDYLDMNGEQKSWLNERLKTHLSWHCQTQLPGYLAWLDRVRNMVTKDQITDQQIQARSAEAKQAIARVVQTITPSAVELLRGLDDQQVEEMRQAFADDVRKRQEKHVKIPLDKQISNRVARMERRLTPWLGELNPAQRQRIEAWSRSLGEQHRQWIVNRVHWQTQFTKAVEQRQSPEFPHRIEVLLRDRESLWTPEYRLAYNRTEAAVRSMLVDVMQLSSPAQRQHLEQKLADVRQDVSELKCLEAVSQS
ncbi:hypothetical protein GUY40_23875 [Pseudomonas sp. R5(2019)]|nr:hypothetical protein [Pseudomonas sp. R5(2019)]